MSDNKSQADELVIRIKNDKFGRNLLEYLAEGADAEARYFKDDSNENCQQMYKAWQDLLEQIRNELKKAYE